MIVEQKDMPKARQTVMFSATFPVPIQRLARDFLQNELLLRVGKVGTTKSITHTIKYVTERDKEKALLTELEKAAGLTLGKSRIFSCEMTFSLDKKKNLPLANSFSCRMKMSIHMRKFGEKIRVILCSVCGP